VNAKRRFDLPAAACAISIALALAPVTATAQAAAYAGASLAIAIDGGPFETVASWSGGDPRAKPVAGTTPLQINGFAYAPLVVDVAIGSKSPGGAIVGANADRIIPWVTDFLAARDGTHTVDLIVVDFAGKIQAGSIHATNVRLTEVHTPALDGAGKSTLLLTLVMAPQQTQALATGTSPSNGLTIDESWVSDFRFQLSGVSQERTTHVEPIAFSRSGTGPVAISNIVEDEALASAGDLLAWRDDFVVQGHNGGAYRRSISLDLLSHTGTPVLSFQFSGVGILSAASSFASGSESVKMAHAELFAGGVSATTSNATTSSRTGTTTGTPTGSTIGAKADIPAATTSATTTPGVATHVGPTAAATTASAAGAAGASATNAADQGARDPAGVPRLAGLTRTAYTSSRDKTSQTEIANYSTGASVDDTAASYENAIKGVGGWDESSRNEQGDTGKRTHLIILVCRKPQNTLTINVGDLSPTGTTVRVLLVTQL
jgi:hypothetical protein